MNTTRYTTNRRRRAAFPAIILNLLAAALTALLLAGCENLFQPLLDGGQSSGPGGGADSGATPGGGASGTDAGRVIETFPVQFSLSMNGKAVITEELAASQAASPSRTVYPSTTFGKIYYTLRKYNGDATNLDGVRNDNDTANWVLYPNHIDTAWPSAAPATLAVERGFYRLQVNAWFQAADAPSGGGGGNPSTNSSVSGDNWIGKSGKDALGDCFAAGIPAGQSESVPITLTGQMSAGYSGAPVKAELKINMTAGAAIADNTYTQITKLNASDKWEYPDNGTITDLPGGGWEIPAINGNVYTLKTADTGIQPGKYSIMVRSHIPDPISYSDVQALDSDDKIDAGNSANVHKFRSKEYYEIWHLYNGADISRGPATNGKMEDHGNAATYTRLKTSETSIARIKVVKSASASAWSGNIQMGPIAATGAANDPQNSTADISLATAADSALTKINIPHGNIPAGDTTYMGEVKLIITPRDSDAVIATKEKNGAAQTNHELKVECDEPGDLPVATVTANNKNNWPLVITVTNIPYGTSEDPVTHGTKVFIPIWAEDGTCEEYAVSLYQQGVTVKSVDFLKKFGDNTTAAIPGKAGVADTALNPLALLSPAGLGKIYVNKVSGNNAAVTEAMGIKITGPNNSEWYLPSAAEASLDFAPDDGTLSGVDFAQHYDASASSFDYIDDSGKGAFSFSIVPLGVYPVGDGWAGVLTLKIINGAYDTDGRTRVDAEYKWKAIFGSMTVEADDSASPPDPLPLVVPTVNPSADLIAAVKPAAPVWGAIFGLPATPTVVWTKSAVLTGANYPTISLSPDTSALTAPQTTVTAGYTDGTTDTPATGSTVGTDVYMVYAALSGSSRDFTGGLEVPVDVAVQSGAGFSWGSNKLTIDVKNPGEPVSGYYPPSGYQVLVTRQNGIIVGVNAADFVVAGSTPTTGISNTDTPTDPVHKVIYGSYNHLFIIKKAAFIGNIYIRFVWNEQTGYAVITNP